MSDNERERKAVQMLQDAGGQPPGAAWLMVAAAGVQATLALVEEIRKLREGLPR